MRRAVEKRKLSQVFFHATFRRPRGGVRSRRGVWVVGDFYLPTARKTRVIMGSRGQVRFAGIKFGTKPEGLLEFLAWKGEEERARATV